MYVTPISGASVVSGLTWLRSSGWALADLLHERKAQGYVALAQGDLEMVGVLTDTIKGRAYSLAALASLYAGARSAPNAAFILKGLDEQSWLMVGLLDGLPVPGYDDAGSQDHITALLDRFRIATKGIDVAVFADVAIPEAQRLSFDELLSHVGDNKAARILAAPGNPKGRWLVIGAIVAAICYVGWEWWLDYRRLELEAEQSANIRPPEQIYQEAVAAALPKAGWPMSDALRVIDYMAAIDLDRGGWHATQVTCSQAENGCIVNWGPELPGASYATLAAQTKGGMQRLELQQDKVLERVAIPNTRALSPWNAKTLRSSADFMTGVVSQLQRLSATGALTVTVKHPVAWPPDAPKVAEGVRRGQLTVSGAHWLLPMLATLDARDLALTDITVTTSGGFTAVLNFFCSGK